VSRAALRPGVARGFYPERVVAREGRGERALRALLGRLARPRTARLARFVRKVEELGAPLRDEADAELAARIEPLRGRLHREGFADHALADCFALVRECARRTLGTPHFDVQLMGGFVLARGAMAEMETGEGKTLTATLPAAAAALAGIPVHVISSNDYLVQRDADAMRPLYAALGLRVGAVTERQKDAAERRAAYACDVTYGTSKQIAFDYLRDGLTRGRGRGGLALQLERLHRAEPRMQHLLLRGLCFAIVDEADSVLIDEARTPLLLAGAGGSSEERRTYLRALRLARSMEEGPHFRLEGRDGRVELTDIGRRHLDELARPLGGPWAGARRREDWVRRALAALHCFQRDRHYLVREDRVEIIDQPTGRRAPDRSWERGLHQLIELKEGCSLTPERETLARISYQQFFRRYLRLAGMTGTAQEAAAELWSVYGLRTTVIPTRLPVQRKRLGARVFATAHEQWEAVIESTCALHARGRPMLIGTASVAASDDLSRRLAERGLEHAVLNARHEAEEAQIVAQAGQPGRITVATNMAGRGTDIRLGPGVAQRGGLHVIATQRGEARRIDRQLFGRCGRQGDPGSCEAILSLDDERVRRSVPTALLRALRRLGSPGRPLRDRVASALTLLPQLADERRSAGLRRNLVELEEYLEDFLAFAGPGD